MWSDGLVNYRQRLEIQYGEWIRRDYDSFAEHIKSKRDRGIDSFYSNAEAEMTLLDIEIAGEVEEWYLEELRLV